MTGPDTLLGRVLDDKYRLDDVLGAGGMGIVFRAADLRLSRSVAVKLVRGEIGAVGATDWFHREARAVARLRHSNIVTIHDFGVAEGVGAYIVMELLDGRSLRQELVARGRLPFGEVVEIGRQACRALDAAHKAGVVHRDVKPENMFLEGEAHEPTVKVVDFGIARLEAATDTLGRSASRAEVLGTPRYMSPEQFEAGCEEDARSDVYSLGCVLYEALAGRPPFKTDSVAALLLAHMHETPSPPRRHAPDVPEAVEAAILRALAKRPEDRFQTAGDFGRALGLGTAGAETIVVEDAAAPRAFVFGPFRLPLDVELLYRDGEAVALERQAVRLLRYLVSNRDRVVTKQELLDALWPDTFTTDSVLKRLVSITRAALGDDAKEPRYLRTYHGRGYQFVGAVTVDDADGARDRRADTDPGSRTAVTQEVRPTNLPHAVTSFVGRASEVAGVREALASSRLVTLVGPGGIGKTRLGVEAARHAFADHPDGVWLVELASLSDPALVPHAVAAVLGVRERPECALLDTLAAWLANKRLLLVLDNCEHLVDACAALVERLLPAAANLRVLATSREALDIDGEAVRPVPALGSEAVRLFVDRARAAKAGFAPTPDDEAAIARLCSALEGIPLSIELAAARVRAFAVEELLSRVSDRFSLLARGRDHGGRHRALRATIDWSYDLLSAEERSLFARLSVFAGGWTKESAGSVTQHSALSTQHSLDRLVDRSLVVADREGARYRMLETIREYAREKLVESGEETRVRAAHRDWVLGLAEEASAAWSRPGVAGFYARLEAEHDNVRAALRWSLETRNFETYARLCIALRLFWDARGHWGESARWLAEALAVRGELPPSLRASVAYIAGAQASRLGDLSGANALVEEALELQRGLGERTATAMSLWHLGLIATAMGEYDRAETVLGESLTLSREAADELRVAMALAGLGYVTMERGRYEDAERLYGESLDLNRRLGHDTNVRLALHNLGDLAARRGDLDRAERMLGECLDLARGDEVRVDVARTLQVLASIAVRRGDATRARLLLRESVEIAREIGDRPGIALVVETYAALSASGGDAGRALRLAGAASALRETIGAPLSPSEREDLDAALESARRALGDESARRETDAGARMAVDEAVAYALGT